MKTFQEGCHVLSSRTASASLGPQHLSSRCWHALAIFQEELHLGAVQSVTGPAHHLSSRPSERWWQGPQGQHRASVACRHCALLMSMPWDGAVGTLLPSVLKMLSLLLVVPLPEAWAPKGSSDIQIHVGKGGRAGSPPQWSHGVLCPGLWVLMALLHSAHA